MSQVSGVPVISKTSSPSEPRRSRTASQIEPVCGNRAPTPEEGLRLVKAFHRIKEARLRDAATNFVEGLADTHDLDAAVRRLLD
jgi:hypothetical protein